MPTYISLINYTEQGVKNIKDAPQRLDAAKAAFKAAGGEMTHVFLTLGRYDLVAISELPNDETGATLALAIAAQGNIRTETMRAFNEDEIKSIVGKLP